ncbi:MAG: hypothetical protein AT716_03040 [Vulcanisaeta sp. MG_3]|nr:MAG: hypothetical protein AT716_03040 [Vulcanisaeta sp. MG_3]
MSNVIPNPFPLAVDAPIKYYPFARDKARFVGEPIILCLTLIIVLFPVGVGLWGCLDDDFQGVVPLDVESSLFVLCLFVEFLELLTAYLAVVVYQKQLGSQFP